MKVMQPNTVRPRAHRALFDAESPFRRPRAEKIRVRYQRKSKYPQRSED